MAAAVVFLVVIPGPPLYGCFAHPLARLDRRVSNDMGWAQADSAFAAYAARHGDEDDLQFVRTIRDVPIKESTPRGAEMQLYLYDWFFMDDLQLTAWFDGNGELLGTFYLCD